MKNYRTAINKAGFHALANPLSSYVIKHSAKISSGGYTAGNVALMVKDGVNVSLDSAAGAAYLLCSLSMAMTEKHPVAGFRITGGFALLGSALLIGSALNIGNDVPVNPGKLAGAGVQVAVASLLLFQNEIANAASRAAQGAKSVFNRAASITAQYPVMVSAVLDFSSSAGFAIGAVRDSDVGMMIAMGLWGIGLTGLTASDPRLKELHAAIKGVGSIFRARVQRTSRTMSPAAPR